MNEGQISTDMPETVRGETLAQKRGSVLGEVLTKQQKAIQILKDRFKSLTEILNPICRKGGDPIEVASDKKEIKSPLVLTTEMNTTNIHRIIQSIENLMRRLEV